MNDTEINVKGEKRTARFCRRGGAAVVVGASLALAGGVPVLVGLTLFGILLRLGVKWLKRVGRSV